MMKKQINYLSFLKAKSYKLKASSGFSLVELLVAVALFGTVATLIILAYRKVSGHLFVTNLAYELALSFREAQSFGVSVHEFYGGDSGTFNVGYGLHFDSGSQDTYALFADQGGEQGDALLNGSFGAVYDGTGCLSTAECIKVFLIGKGNKIYKFCGVLPTGDLGKDAPDNNKNEECNTLSLPASNPTITYLDVTFLRPNPDAIIKTNQSALGQQYKAARVYVISPSGDTRVVEAANTGQISVR
jgi:prepilin-type N-terminal cleavage/methylation domain-containing protein